MENIEKKKHWPSENNVFQRPSVPPTVWERQVLSQPVKEQRGVREDHHVGVTLPRGTPLRSLGGLPQHSRSGDTERGTETPLSLCPLGSNPWAATAVVCAKIGDPGGTPAWAAAISPNRCVIDGHTLRSRGVVQEPAPTQNFCLTTDFLKTQRSRKGSTPKGQATSAAKFVPATGSCNLH